MRRKLTFAGIFCLVFVSVVGLSFLNVGAARANGAPVKIILTYLPDVSNWGPTSATGVAEVVMKEGEVNLSVVGLPSLADETYTGWLINTRNSESLEFGHFNTDSSGIAKLDARLPSEIPDTGWNLVLITVEPKGNAVESPGNRKSIGGYFPEAAGSKRLPSQLPKTGGDTSPGSAQGKTGSAEPSSSNAAPTTRAQTQGTDFQTFGVILVAAVGVGMFARVRMRRR